MKKIKILVDILIDKFTLCLEERKTGKIYETMMELVNINELKAEREIWNFD